MTVTNNNQLLINYTAIDTYLIEGVMAENVFIVCMEKNYSYEDLEKR